MSSKWQVWIEGLLLAFVTGFGDAIFLTHYAPGAFPWKEAVIFAAYLGGRTGLAYIKNNRPPVLDDKTAAAVTAAAEAVKQEAQASDGPKWPRVRG